MAAPRVAPGPSDVPGLRPNRACRHCVQIKAKCIPLEGSNDTICQRCHRLGKECTTPAPVQRKRRQVKTTRVSQLEEKINTLTDLLTTGKTPATTSPPQSDTAANNAEDIPDQPQSTLPTPPVSIIQETGPCKANPENWYHALGCNIFAKPGKRLETGTATASSGHFRSFELAPVIEEKLFSDFRTEMNLHFPFVVIPPQATTAAIREGKPFLFRTCLAAACHADPVLQRQMSEDLIKYVGDRMLLRGEKSLDLLQGLLVLTSWYQYYNQNNPQLMNLLHLAMAMTIDLGINRPSHTVPMPALGATMDTNQFIHGRSYNTGLQTSDERRALLGVYYFAARLSTCFRGLDIMRWTQHLEDCCSALTVAAEYPSDAYAVQLVELDRLVERYSSFIVTQSIGAMPVHSYVNGVEEDMRRYRRNLPAALADDRLVQLNLQSAHLGLYEPILFIETRGSSTIHRVSALHGCLDQIQRYVEAFLELPLGWTPTLPFSVFLQNIQVLTMLSRLSFLVADGWDLNYIRTSDVNFSSVTERMSQWMRDVAEHCKRDTRLSAISAKYLMYADKLGLCKKWYESKVRAEAESAASTQEGTAALPAFDVPFEALFEGLDTHTWGEFSVDWMPNTSMQF